MATAETEEEEVAEAKAVEEAVAEEAAGVKMAQVRGPAPSSCTGHGKVREMKAEERRARAEQVGREQKGGGGGGWSAGRCGRHCYRHC